MNYFIEAAVFLLSAIFGIYLLAMMLRFIMALVRADFRNPLSRLLIKITNPPLIPLRRFIPSFAGMDTSAIVVMLALQVIELLLVDLLLYGAIPKIAGLLVTACAELLWLVVVVFYVTLIVQVVISWINPGAHGPGLYLLHQINDPLLRRARRILPPQGALDLSPLIVFLGLGLVHILAVKPLAHLGQTLS